MVETLFSYGTLRKTSVQLALFGRPLIGAEDYRLAPIEITDAAFLARGRAETANDAAVRQRSLDSYRYGKRLTGC